MIMTRGPFLRRIIGTLSVALAVALVVGCSGSNGQASSRPTTTAPSTAVPTTPVGQQLSWLLAASSALPIDAATITAHVGPAFLAQVPPDKFNAVLRPLTPRGGLTLSSITSASPSVIVALVGTTQGPLRLNISAQPDGRIGGLVLQPPTTAPAVPTSWGEVDKRLNAVAPETAMLTAQVDSTGTCIPIHAVDPTTPRPLGSMFKLYVLGAVAQKIDAGALSWDTPLPITADIKSLPSGELQDRPDDSTVTVLDAATKMIAISDNTAADLLARAVGRQAVESMQGVFRSSNAALNVPFLRTREMFVLKGADYPKQRDAYLALPPNARADYLAKTVDNVAPATLRAWTQPRDIHTLEWFASPQDICQAFAALDTLATKPALQPLAKILSTSDGGLHLDANTWPSVWFKGGSEPGVLTLGWRAKAANGRTVVTIVMSADPNKAINETTATPEMIALAGGAFTLAP